MLVCAAHRPSWAGWRAHEVSLCVKNCTCIIIVWCIYNYISLLYIKVFPCNLLCRRHFRTIMTSTITVMTIMRVTTVPITIPIPRTGGRTCREAIPDTGKQVYIYIINVLLEELKDKLELFSCWY